jgi:amino acid transporter
MTTPEQISLKREIGKLGYGAMVLNGMIGAGIFALPAVAAERSGVFSPWMFLISGAMILAVVLSFARAASFFRDTGGPFQYTGHAFGPFVGFQTGWLLTLSRVAALAANTNLMVIYAAWFWSPLESGFAHAAAVGFVLLFLCVLNILGVRKGMLAIYALTLLKLIPLSLVVLLGLSSVNPELFTSFDPPPFDGFGETILIVLYAFIGFESAVVPAGEGRNPRKDIPWALVRTVLAIAAFYFIIQVVVISVAPDIGGSEKPLVDVALILMGPLGAAVLTLGAVFSIGGNSSSSMLSAPRLIYALSKEKSLPEWFGRVHPKYQTPANSIMAYGLLALALSLSGGFVFLAVMSTVVRLIVYALSIASIPRLEKTIAQTEGQFQLPGGFTIPAMALVMSIWLTSHASLKSWLVTGAFVILGSVFYVVSRRRRLQESPQTSA